MRWYFSLSDQRIKRSQMQISTRNWKRSQVIEMSEEERSEKKSRNFGGTLTKRTIISRHKLFLDSKMWDKQRSTMSGRTRMAQQKRWKKLMFPFTVANLPICRFAFWTTSVVAERAKRPRIELSDVFISCALIMINISKSILVFFLFIFSFAFLFVGRNL